MNKSLFSGVNNKSKHFSPVHTGREIQREEILRTIIKLELNASQLRMHIGKHLFIWKITKKHDKIVV